METFYLVDFENVHNEGLEKITTLMQTDHVHIFYTKNASNIRKIPKGIDCKKHKVSDGDESLDMHLVSYLGYLLGIHGKDCAYIIISEDKDYDNIIKFWKKIGYPNILKARKICEGKIYVIMQRELADMGYSKDDINRICEIVVDHCNDEKILRGIHNDVRKIYNDNDYLMVYNDVKIIVENSNL